MVEKVTAAGEEVAPGNQDRAPTQATAAAPGDSVGPTEHLKAQTTDMADPNGKCRACGAEISAGATLCSHCHMTARDLNERIDDFAKRAKAAGWNDNQIRQGAEDFAKQMKQDLADNGPDGYFGQNYEAATQAQGYVDNPPAWLKAVK